MYTDTSDYKRPTVYRASERSAGRRGAAGPAEVNERVRDLYP